MVIGIGTASAIGIITLAGDVIVTGGMDVVGSITGQTISDLDNRVSELESPTCIPTTETCNGIDDDCDGSIDEDFANLGTTCIMGDGICAMQGFFVCNAADDNTECSAVASVPGLEVCNGLDDDCDGSVDEGFLNSATGKYDQDTACGSCFVDCTVIFNTPNAQGTCDSTAAPVCQLICNPGFQDADANPANGCELAVNTNVIHVSETTGTDSNTCGSINDPCATITHGLTRAIADGNTEVHVASGFYPESVTLVNGINLSGGYNPVTWQQNPTTNPTIIQGDSTSIHKNTLIANFITSSTTVDGFVIVGQDSFSTSGNSYAVLIRNSNNQLVIDNNLIFSGFGGAGLSGVNGGNGLPGVDGNSGLDSFETDGAPCGSSNDVQLANRGQRTCGADNVSGGNGGGVACSPIFNTETSGSDGFSGQPGSGGGGGSAGSGGDAGDDARLSNNGFLCEVPSSPKFGTDGSDGSSGGNGFSGVGCSIPAGSIVSGHWQGNPGNLGGIGSNGGGGGGGGAGGGSESNSAGFNDVLGAHGGGGGSGACGGNGGFGSTAGGGSFGIFLITDSVSSVPIITNNQIRLGNGGQGGNGGFGGAGGLGGLGDLGGTSGFSPPLFCSGSSGKGGNGGNGGQGAGGGGACGGISYGIYASALGDASWSSGNTFITIGSPGNGGSGGLSLGNSGGNGQAGTQANTNFP